MDKHPNDQDFTAITASIYYLEQEAGRAGIDSLRVILRNTLTEIDVLVNSGEMSNVPTYGRIIDCNLYKILMILSGLSDIKRLDLQAILLALTDAQKEKISH
jgi:replicative DNA helicase